MSQILKLTHENQKLKRQINQYQQVLGVSPYVDDSLFKGGYRVVKTVNDRDNIDCCHSKQGMIVCVIGGDLSFKEYRLISDCKNKQWEEIQTQVTENDVILVEDYSELSENLTTQKELNLVLKELILKLQTQINNIELIDEKVIITEDTNFAQIGDTQKDFNKNVSIYKNNNDLKNQEQDDRLSDIEGKNIAQDDLINDLSIEIVYENVRNVSQDSRLENLEGINYTWSPTNRTLTLFDRVGNQLSQVSLVSLDNEGTDLRYNASTLSLELYNANNELLDSIPVSSFISSVGAQLQLNSNQLQLRDRQGNVLSTVSFSINNIQGLQIALDSKLNKGSYPGNASDLKTEIDGKANSSHTHPISEVTNLQTTLNSKQDKLQDITGNVGVGKTDASATEKLDVNGNVKATQIKNQYGTLKSQRCITITGNTTLSEIHNGAVLNVTNTCNITIPTGLDINFQCVIFAKGSIIVTFVNSGVTIYAPSGLLLKQDKMASLICTSTNNFNLTGELATS